MPLTVTPQTNATRMSDEAIESKPSPDLHPSRVPRNFTQALSWMGIAICAFGLAHSFQYAVPLLLCYLVALYQLSRLGSSRLSFYAGFLVGTVSYAMHLTFFWNIFGPAAILLWMILGFWIGLFVLISHQLQSWPNKVLTLLPLTLLWLGLEYFRCELYPLKFSWLTVGSRFVEQSFWGTAHLGVYGTGALVALAAAYISSQPERRTFVSLIASTAILGFAGFISKPSEPTALELKHPVHVGGIQLEFPSEREIIRQLNSLVNAHPEVELLVLSEYTIDTAPSTSLLDWCRANKKHLILGGKQAINNTQYRNTAFVIGPRGKIEFTQAKSEPIQFFDDGEPAQSQKLWDSPWGKIGIAICYDLSFSRVIDELIRQGAQILIIPTMDVVAWGEREHRLHAKIAPARAQEYQVPIFRLASSGISQSVTAQGTIAAAAPFPGQGAFIVDTIQASDQGRLPIDRWIAAPSSLLALAACLFLGLQKARHLR